MFTGIITDIAQITDLRRENDQDLLIGLKINNRENLDRKLEIGCSIACNGICLTLVKLEKKEDFHAYFQASDETISRTSVKNWQIGDKINIEFAMKLGDELGGHLVSGHVDDVILVKSILKIAESHKFTFIVNSKLAKFICEKGSVALDGTSLTVNSVSNDEFQVNIIDHTFHNTNFGFLKTGDKVNLEVDQIARYLDRLVNYNKS